MVKGGMARKRRERKRKLYNVVIYNKDIIYCY